jgi:hypothetical protein
MKCNQCRVNAALTHFGVYAYLLVLFRARVFVS